MCPEPSPYSLRSRSRSPSRRRARTPSIASPLAETKDVKQRKRSTSRQRQAKPKNDDGNVSPSTPSSEKSPIASPAPIIQQHITPNPTSSSSSSSNSIWIALLLLLSALFTLFLVIRSMPPLEPEAQALWSSVVSTHMSLDDVLSVASTLRVHAEQYTFHVTLASFILYVTLQTFCIPGTIALNILLGALFGFKFAFLFCLIAATMGASFCFTLARLLGQFTLQKRFPNQSEKFQKLLTSHGSSGLFFGMLSIRVSPLVPNWFVNMASGAFGVPFKHFCIATAIGLIPGTYIPVNVGVMLERASSNGAAAGAPPSQADYAIMLFGLSIAALLPNLLSYWLNKRNQNADKKAEDNDNVPSSPEPINASSISSAVDMQTPERRRIRASSQSRV